ncbi:MAG: amidohydrolase family protein [Pseudobdellovibrionaceae bacterium]
MRKPKPIFILTALVSLVIFSHSALGAKAILFNDSHFHLTNYVQEGITAQRLLQLMGEQVGRSTLFGIPLQQQWSHRVSDASNPPTYYLQTDAPLYYYSFTDAAIAMAYKSLTKSQQERLDPMITGFNPTDMYAADHIRRVLETFPGVFTGIGEFSIHKEFVSSKVAGEVASLKDPAVDRILDFAGQVGLLVILHNDIDTPFPKKGDEPTYLAQMRNLLIRHPETKIIWAHMGVGRIVRPIHKHLAAIESLLKDPRFKHIYFDISWMETAKYIITDPRATKLMAELIHRHPDRFLFGTDEVAPKDSTQYLSVYEAYKPLWSALNESASEKVRTGNYVRLFDEARKKVRAWEKANVLENKETRISQARN